MTLKVKHFLYSYVNVRKASLPKNLHVHHFEFLEDVQA